MVDKKEEWIELDENGQPITENDYIQYENDGSYTVYGNEDAEVMELQRQVEESRAEEAAVTPADDSQSQPGILGKIKKKWTEYKEDKAMERKRLETVRKEQEERLRKAKLDVKQRKIQEKYTEKIQNLNKTPTQRFEAIKVKAQTAFGGISAASGSSGKPKEYGIDRMLRSNTTMRGNIGPSVRAAPGLDSMLRPRQGTGARFSGSRVAPGLDSMLRLKSPRRPLPQLRLKKPAFKLKL